MEIALGILLFVLVAAAAFFIVQRNRKGTNILGSGGRDEPGQKNNLE